MADEIKEEKLDSPLVVHKKGDASYQEENNEVSMQNTHVDEDSDAPTLERHRFKKEKKMAVCACCNCRCCSCCYCRAC